MKRIALAAIVAAGIVLATLSTSLAAASGATCAECCEADATCQILAELADLRATVDELVPDAAVESSLDAKVDATTTSVLDSRFTPALGQLDAFGNEVDGLASAGRLSASVSSALKTKHDTVKNSISNVR